MDETNESSYISDGKKNSSSPFFKLLTILSIILSIIILIFFLRINNKVNKVSRILSEQTQANDTLKNDLSKLKLEYYLDKLIDQKGFVDLTTGSIQEIGDGFMVVSLNVEQHLTGIKVSGRIINSTALRHRNIKFNIKVGNQNKDFYINQISSGNSTWFNVYIPEVPIEDSKYATIKYLESSVSYYTE